MSMAGTHKLNATQKLINLKAMFFNTPGNLVLKLVNYIIQNNRKNDYKNNN